MAAVAQADPATDEWWCHDGNHFYDLPSSAATITSQPEAKAKPEPEPKPELSLRLSLSIRLTA